MIDRSAPSIDRLGLWFGVALTVMLAFTVVAPYVFDIKSTELIRQIDQTQNTIQNLCLILAGFLYGTSVGKRMQEETIVKQATTIQAAQAALAPQTDAPTIPVEPGESVTVKGEDA